MIEDPGSSLVTNALPPASTTASKLFAFAPEALREDYVPNGLGSNGT
jgi:hypothetical protein